MAKDGSIYSKVYIVFEFEYLFDIYSFTGIQEHKINPVLILQVPTKWIIQYLHL